MGMNSDESRIVHSGSLLRGVKIGTRRDATMESAFQLEAYGEIGEDVEITAIMSDQNLPIQPEGTSEKIAQLEQVSIIVKGPFFGATFGDFSTSFAESEFSQYSRRLSGVRLDAFTEQASIQAVGAILEGIWASMEFHCVEGNQGPYQIRAPGTSAVQILAGTETVWLNGARLKRGQDYDYTIDYNLGQITFSTSRPVGTKDRVVVDFQYTDIDFRRSFYGATGGIQPFDGLKFTYSAMVESDDPENPLTIEFGDDEIIALESAGDNVDSAYIITAYMVESGDYILIESPEDGEYFEWVGGGDGDWNVDFRHVGTGNGDYIFISAGQYEFVGAGGGSYRPIRFLPLPASHSIIDIGAEVAISDWINVYGEAAISMLDRNRLSNLGNEDNSGGAWTTKIDLSKNVNILGANLGKLTMNANLRQKSENFATIGRLDDAEFRRDWGFSEVSGEENLAEATVTYRPWMPLSISGTYGANRIGATTNKRMSSNLLYQTEWLNLSANSSRIQSERTWDRYWGNFSAKVWNLCPEASARFEDKDGANGFRFYEIFSSLAFVPNDNINIAPGFDYRHDETGDSMGLTPESRVRTLKLSSQFYNWKITANRRYFEDLTGGGADIKSDLGRIEGTIRLAVPRSDFRLRYELSNRQSEVLEPIFEFVGYGAGNYEFDPDRAEYIPSAGGEYLRRFIPTGNFTPAVGSDFRANVATDLSNLEGESEALHYIKLLSLDGFLRLESSSSRGSANAYLLNPSKMFERNDLSFGRYNAEGNLRVGARKSRGITLRRRVAKSRNAQFTTGEEVRRSGEWTLEGRLNLSKVGNFIGTAKIYETARLYPADPRTGADITGAELDIAWSKLLDNNFQASIATSLIEEADDRPDEPVQIRRVALRPGAAYFFKAGNIRADLQYSRVATSGEYRGILPYEMAQGDFLGNNGKAMVLANINITTGTTLTLNYELVSRSKRRPAHTASASVRLVF